MNATLIPPVSSLAQARRKCAVRILLATISVIALLSLALLAALDLWMPFPRALRTGIALVGATAILIAVIRGLRAARRRHTTNSAAQAIETARPELGQQIRTALEVAERGIRRDADQETQIFAKRLLAESQASLTKQSWRSLIPSARAAIWILTALALIAVIAVGAKRSSEFRLALSRLVLPITAPTYTELSWSIAPKVFDERHPPRMELRVERRLAEPRLFVRERGGAWTETPMTPLPDGRSWDIVLSGRQTDLEVYATAGDARTPPHALVFKPIPKLVAVRTKLVFPDYTGRAPETRNLGDVSVVEDTQVRWEFAFNVVPDRVEWSVGTDPASRLTVDPATKTATVEWKAGTARANATVSVLDHSGEPIDSWRYMAEGFTDALPSVELLEPVKDSEATSVTELPVRIRAKDDFGVSEVGLILEAAGHRDWVFERVIPERDQRSVTEIAAAMLEKIPLTIRDNVRLYAYALDHKPRGGPRSVSPLRSIDIREFKKRWAFQESDGGFGGNRQQIAEGLMKVGQLITAQRSIVSDSFVLRETIRSTGAAVTSSALPIGQREAELVVKGIEIRDDWIDKGGIPPDDVTLLDTAVTQMQEAAQSLGLKGPANVDKGFTTADRALSTLLQLRKRLLTILMRGSQGEKPSSEEQLRPLADLAREAERLAREEKDMHDQLAPEAIAGTNLEATKRQHEVALSDAGELYAAMVDHPQINEPAIRLMGDAEKSMRAADEKLHGEQARDAAPELALAERRLLEVAQFLRAMELTEVNETLRKLANEAEQNARSTRGSVQGKPDPDKESKGQDKSSTEDRRISQAARDTGRIDEILGALAEKAGGRNQTADVEDQGMAGSLGETLTALREQVAAGKLAQELKGLADAQQKGEGDSANIAAQGDAAATKLDGMAREFRETAKRLEATRAANLAAAQAQARELQKQLAEAGDKQGNKGAGEGKKGESNKPGDKPGLAKNEGKGPGEKPGSGEGKGQKPGDKPGGGGAGKGDKPGDKAGNKPGDKPGEQGLAKGEQPGKAGAGNKPEDNKQGGRGGIAGDQENAKEGPGGQAMGRFAKTLRSVGDERLNDFAIKLFNAPFSLESLPDVEAAAERIRELIAELPATGGPVASAGRLPESRRREVEDYFRSLSDDFDGEQWDAPKKPGQNAE